MAKKLVALDAGHGGFGVTPGKRTPDGEYEWDFNNKVIVAAAAKLTANGVDVIRVDDPTGRTDVGLTARTNKANAAGADVYVSSHHNANTGKWGNWTGTETFTYLGSQPESEKLAKEVQSRLVKAYGLRDRGLKKDNFAVVRQTKMPAILTEGGYMDSTIDIKKMRDNSVLKAAGEAIADGVLAYFGMSNNKPAPATQKTDKKPASSSKSSSGGSIVDYLKSKGIDASFSNRKKLAAEYGVKGYEGTASQNVTLLEKMKAGKKVSAPAKSSTKKYPAAKSGEGIVDYLKRIGVNSSFSNREKLASQYGIKGYKGTASQNNQLLDKLSGSKTSSGSSKSIEQMAKEIVRGVGIPNRHEARRKHFGISAAEYEQVRKRVNQLL
jgi:N-acetylmuramoyl-L-alanine amidase